MDLLRRARISPGVSPFYQRRIARATRRCDVICHGARSLLAEVSHGPPPLTPPPERRVLASRPQSGGGEGFFSRRRGPSAPFSLITTPPLRHRLRRLAKPRGGEPHRGASQGAGGEVERVPAIKGREVCACGAAQRARHACPGASGPLGVGANPGEGRGSLKGDWVGGEAQRLSATRERVSGSVRSGAMRAPRDTWQGMAEARVHDERP